MLPGGRDVSPGFQVLASNSEIVLTVNEAFWFDHGGPSPYTATERNIEQAVQAVRVALYALANTRAPQQ